MWDKVLYTNETQLTYHQNVGMHNVWSASVIFQT